MQSSPYTKADLAALAGAKISEFRQSEHIVRPCPPEMSKAKTDRVILKEDFMQSKQKSITPLKLLKKIPADKNLESSPYVEQKIPSNDRVHTFEVSFGTQMTTQAMQIENTKVEVYGESEPPKRFVRRINFSQQAERARIPFIQDGQKLRSLEPRADRKEGEIRLNLPSPDKFQMVERQKPHAQQSLSSNNAAESSCKGGSIINLSDNWSQPPTSLTSAQQSRRINHYELANFELTSDFKQNHSHNSNQSHEKSNPLTLGQRITRFDQAIVPSVLSSMAPEAQLTNQVTVKPILQYKRPLQNKHIRNIFGLSNLCSNSVLSSNIPLSNPVAVLNKPKDTPSFQSKGQAMMRAQDQNEIVETFKAFDRFAPSSGPSMCLMSRNTQQQHDQKMPKRISITMQTQRNQNRILPEYVAKIEDQRRADSLEMQQLRNHTSSEVVRSRYLQNVRYHQTKNKYNATNDAAQQSLMPLNQISSSPNGLIIIKQLNKNAKHYDQPI